jgi:hypothetical protein
MVGGCYQARAGIVFKKEFHDVKFTISGHLWSIDVPAPPPPHPPGWVYGYVRGATIELTGWGLGNGMSVQTDGSGNYDKNIIIQGPDVG